MPRPTIYATVLIAAVITTFESGKASTFAPVVLSGIEINKADILQEITNNPDYALMIKPQSGNPGGLLEYVSVIPAKGNVADKESRSYIENSRRLQEKISATSKKKFYKDNALNIAQSSTSSLPLKPVREFRLDYIPLMKQKSANDCWAVTAAMMQSWKAKKLVEPQMFVAQAGPRWLRIYEENNGLPAGEKVAFLNDVGLVHEVPMSYMPKAVEDMLRKFGPLWFTVGDRNSIMTHANLLFGIYYADNDEVFLGYIDPADGLEHFEEYGSFMRRYEGAAFMFNELYMEALVSGAFVGAQVVHFADGH